MRKVFLLAVLGLLAALMVAGCAKKGPMIEPRPGEEGEAVAPMEAEAETVTEEAPQMAKLEQEPVTGRYVEDEGASMEFRDIHFDFDMYNIRDDAKPTLDKLSSFLTETDAKVILEGHCDERGTDEYNLALGDRRAQSVKQYLVASGVSRNKIETVSYGEEKPLCEDKTEGCFAQNRRAHFVILSPR
jgi:peptidoglycan-associated lipoprotein